MVHWPTLPSSTPGRRTQPKSLSRPVHQVTTELHIASSINLTLESGTDYHYFFTNTAAMMARVEPIGTSAPSEYTVMTRDKGDLRYGVVSSRRYKEDIEDADETRLVRAFDRLRIRDWIWGGETPPEDERHGRNGVGVIAEEMEPLLPEAVRYRKTESERTVDGLDPVALCVVLAAKLRQLEADLNDLKARSPKW